MPVPLSWMCTFAPGNDAAARVGDGAADVAYVLLRDRRGGGRDEQKGKSEISNEGTAQTWPPIINVVNCLVFIVDPNINRLTCL
jgi:hypothetical protein